MGLRINTNISSLSAQRALGERRITWITTLESYPRARE